MNATTKDSYELSVTQHINATPETVWQVMTDRIEEWWCPTPWHAKVIEQNWCAGGRCAMVFKGPDGETMPQEGIFLEVIPGRRFVTTDAVTGDFRPADPFMIGIWEIDADSGGTRYTATARHWTQEAHDQHRAMGFVEGWQAVAAQLAELCEQQESSEQAAAN